MKLGICLFLCSLLLIVSNTFSKNNKRLNNLVHIDRLLNISDNYTERFTAWMQRDVRRVSAITRLLYPNRSIYEFQEASLGSTIISGLSQGVAEYLVQIEIGTNPSTVQHLAIDTASDLTWVQCHPCQSCFPQTDQIFEPHDSDSFKHKTCGSQACGALGNSYNGCNIFKNECLYRVKYWDGSSSKGVLISEIVSLGGVRIPVALGCGNTNEGSNFKGMSGIIGLGRGAISFINQLEDPVRGGFSYCLLNPYSVLPNSWIEFGIESLPENIIWVPLQYNVVRAPSLYYITMSGIEVGDEVLPIPEDTFKLSGTGEGGVILDSGTAISRFPREIYEMLKSSFIRQTSMIPPAAPRGIFETCYDYSGPEQYDIPLITLYFPPTYLRLGGVATLVNVDGLFTYCFAFAASDSSHSIIGNVHQSTIQISFDLYNGRVGFGPQSC
ncbi:hypothetical protein ACFE04_014160 [Oxalis oulophora]